jgi:hypothetical protein
MATLGGKQQIVTFKAEDALVKAMEDISRPWTVCAHCATAPEF